MEARIKRRLEEAMLGVQETCVQFLFGYSHAGKFCLKGWKVAHSLVGTWSSSCGICLPEIHCFFLGCSIICGGSFKYVTIPVHTCHLTWLDDWGISTLLIWPIFNVAFSSQIVLLTHVLHNFKSDFTSLWLPIMNFCGVCFFVSYLNAAFYFYFYFILVNSMLFIIAVYSSDSITQHVLPYFCLLQRHYVTSSSVCFINNAKTANCIMKRGLWHFPSDFFPMAWDY